MRERTTLTHRSRNRPLRGPARRPPGRVGDYRRDRRRRRPSPGTGSIPQVAGVYGSSSSFLRSLHVQKSKRAIARLGVMALLKTSVLFLVTSPGALVHGRQRQAADGKEQGGGR